MNNWADVVHTHNGILLSSKKEWNLTVRNNMGGLRSIIVPEVNQTVLEKQILDDITDRLNLKNTTNKYNNKKEKDSQM